MKNRLLILSLVLFPNLLTAASNEGDKIKMPGLFAKTLGVISQTKPVCWYNQKISAKTRLNFGTELADPKYQALGKEAQEAVGVPSDRILPIKKFSDSTPAAFLAAVAAIAEPSAIYVNEKKLNERSLGRQRVSLFHESCHVKYNDIATKGLIGWAAMLSGGALAHQAIKTVRPVGRYKALHAVGVLTASSTSATLAGLKYSKFSERRADLEGHIALQCATCVEESAVVTIGLIESSNVLISNGYLSPAELASIANDLEQRNKKCADHS